MHFDPDLIQVPPTLLLIMLAGYLDRMRGSDYSVLPPIMWKGESIGNSEWKILYGWTIAALLGHSFCWMTIPIIILFAIGESPGWGEPTGSALLGKKQDQDRLEYWQVWPLSQDAWASLAFRGLMWGFPVAALFWFDPMLLMVPLVYMISMPVAVAIARHTPGLGNTSDRWCAQEFIRGILSASMIAAVMHA